MLEVIAASWCHIFSLDHCICCCYWCVALGSICSSSKVILMRATTPRAWTILPFVQKFVPPPPIDGAQNLTDSPFSNLNWIGRFRPCSHSIQWCIHRNSHQSQWLWRKFLNLVLCLTRALFRLLLTFYFYQCFLNTYHIAPLYSIDDPKKAASSFSLRWHYQSNVVRFSFVFSECRWYVLKPQQQCHQ